MKKIVVLALFSLNLLLPSVVLAQLNAQNTGLFVTAEAGYGGAVISDQVNIGQYIGNKVIQPVLGLMGILFLLLTVYAGFLWMTAQGEESKVKKAKDILTAAVIGAVIMASAYVLTNALLNAITTGNIVAGGEVG